MNTMKIVSGLVALSATLGAQAGDIVQSRGFNNCAEQIEQKLKQQRPKVSGAFYLAKASDHLTFYLNSTAWQDGKRQAMRTKCMTSTSGHNVLAVNMEAGRFDGVPQAEVETRLTSQ